MTSKYPQIKSWKSESQIESVLRTRLLRYLSAHAGKGRSQYILNHVLYMPHSGIGRIARRVVNGMICEGLLKFEGKHDEYLELVKDG